MERQSTTGEAETAWIRTCSATFWTSTPPRWNCTRGSGATYPEDVVQDAFLKLAAQRELPDNPAAWLFRVVRNGAIDAGQAARRRKRYESAAASWAAPWFEADADERAGSRSIRSRLPASFRALPIEEREIIVAHLWGGLTFEQIAGVAGCSSSTAHRLYARGLLTLRERLGVSCR